MVRGRPGPAPQSAKREWFARLIAQGVSSAQACRMVGVNPRTGKRWRHGRTITSRSAPIRGSGRPARTVRMASRTRRRARLRCTAPPTAREAATATRTVASAVGSARRENSLSLRVTPSARTRAMSSPRRSLAACITACLDDGEALATTGAPRGEHSAASRRLHARTEAVHAGPATGLWLIGTLHDRVPFSKS